MIKDRIGVLSQEDYNTMLAKYVPIKGVQLNPHAYSRQEIEQALLSYWHFMKGIIDKYNVDDTESWVVSEFSGIIYMEDR